MKDRLYKELEEKKWNFVFLGTGAGVPSKGRNVSGNCFAVVRRTRDRLGLFDCGEATQHQILHTSSTSHAALKKIFITHLHGDHIFGLPGLFG